MSKIIKITILTCLLCNCATQKVLVQQNKLEIATVNTNIEPIVLQPVECTKEKQCKILINNFNILRIKYNELLLKYKNDIEYYNKVLDNQKYE